MLWYVVFLNRVIRARKNYAAHSNSFWSIAVESNVSKKFKLYIVTDGFSYHRGVLKVLFLVF